MIDTADKIEYSAKEQGIKTNVTNEVDSKSFVTIYENRFDIDIDQVAQTVVRFASSLKPV